GARADRRGGARGRGGARRVRSRDRRDALVLRRRARRVGARRALLLTRADPLKIPARDAGGGRGGRDVAAVVGDGLLDVGALELVEDALARFGEAEVRAEDALQQIVPLAARR